MSNLINTRDFIVKTVHYIPNVSTPNGPGIILCHNAYNNSVRTFNKNEEISIRSVGLFAVRIPAINIWPGDIIDEPV
jgi:hypothetical protein